MNSEDSNGLGYAFYINMIKYANKTAQIDGLTGQKYTYGELLQRSVRMAIKLQERGIKQDDVVTICSLNYNDTYIPVLATQFLGAVTSALDPTLSLSDISYLLRQVPPKIIFVTPEAVEQIKKACNKIEMTVEIVVFGPTDSDTPFDVFLEANPLEEEFAPVEISDQSKTALVLFSSGTSGLPKGICISNIRFLKSIKIMIEHRHAYDINLSTTSLYWISAHIFLAISVLNGFTRILLPRFSSRDVLNAIEKHQPTAMFATPPQLLEMSNYKIENGGVTESIRHITTGAVAVSTQHVDIIAKAFPKTILFIMYGQTEIGIVSMFKNSSEDIALLRKKPTACGKIFSEFSYKVANLETEDGLGPNKPGELLIRGDILFNGYYNQESSHVWEDGWYKTGDVVYFDDDGCLFIVDRVKEMLKFRTWHVAPAAIELILFTHPAVEKCIVIGVPHEIDGDHPMALVVLKQSHRHVQSHEIQTFVEERVDDRKKLRGGVKIVEEFPTQLTGKVKRRVIRDMVLSGQL